MEILSISMKIYSCEILLYITFYRIICFYLNYFLCDIFFFFVIDDKEKKKDNEVFQRKYANENHTDDEYYF